MASGGGATELYVMFIWKVRQDIRSPWQHSRTIAEMVVADVEAYRQRKVRPDTFESNPWELACH
jgi:hypothetical protein